MTTGRRNIMLGTAGHVDHGKTALVKLLTGCNTDTLAEERARGLTIDLGFAPCRMSDQRIVGIVDVPGHVDFIRNMVAGAHGIDVVILVVAADDGIMPQTREHLNILTLMGLKRGLVALTKIDLVEPDLRDLVAQELRELLAGTFLERASICPLSNVTGEGFDAFFASLDATVSACEDRPCTGLFRAWVADAFTIRGFGTIVTGIPSSGRVRLGDRLYLMPGGRSGRVRRLEVYGEDAAEGRAGECVAVNLPDVDRDAVRRGMVLSESDAVAPVSMIEGELRLLDGLTGRLEDYTEVHLHVGTASVLAHVALLETGEMAGGQSQMVQLRLAEPFGIVPGDRFVIRAHLPGSGSAGLTSIGGGRVFGVSNTRLRRRRAWTLETLTARRAAIDDPLRWCGQILRESRLPLRLDEWARRCLQRETEMPEAVEKLRLRGVVQQTPNGAFVPSENVRQAAARVLAAVEAFHAAEPQGLGLAPADLAIRLGTDPAILELATEALLAAGQLERQGGLLARPGRQVRLSAEDEAVMGKVAGAFQRAGWTVPRPDELVASLGLPRARVEAAIKLLAERGELVRIAGDLVFHAQAIEAAKEVALRLFTRAPSFSTMEFRDALGVSRKYAVPLLDHLDRTRVTVRSGHTRTPGAEARKRMG